MSFKFTGLDEFKKELQNLQDKVTSLDGSTVPFDELFTCSFMKQHTNVCSFDDFLKEGNFIVETQEDFEAIPDKEFDKYVSSSTDFNSWDDMLSAATDIYLENLF